MKPTEILEGYTLWRPVLFKYVVKTIASRQDADDILQDCFLWLWSNRERLNHITDLKAFMYGMVRHKVYNRTRHKKYERDYIKYVLAHYKHIKIDPVDVHAVLENAVSTLTDRELQAFIMNQSLGLSNNEIAKRLGISKRTVENYNTTALRKIKAYLSRD